MLRLSTLTAIMLAAATAQTFAQDSDGESEYMVACAVCHGESGKGAGPFAPLLNIEVPGLTTLAADNEGEFPFLKTFMMIDGRSPIRAHGSEMPVWGDRYLKSAREYFGPYGAEIVTNGRILSLVNYLETIQE